MFDKAVYLLEIATIFKHLDRLYTMPDGQRRFVAEQAADHILTKELSDLNDPLWVVTTTLDEEYPDYIYKVQCSIFTRGVCIGTSTSIMIQLNEGEARYSSKEVEEVVAYANTQNLAYKIAGHAVF